MGCGWFRRTLQEKLRRPEVIVAVTLAPTPASDLVTLRRQFFGWYQLSHLERPSGPVAGGLSKFAVIDRRLQVFRLIIVLPELV
jgi:hypothetical protein